MFKVTTKEDTRRPESRQSVHPIRSRPSFPIQNRLSDSALILIIGSAHVGKIIHAESFADVNPEHKAEEIYTFLVDKPVYAQMKKDYGEIGRPVPFIKK